MNFKSLLLIFLFPLILLGCAKPLPTEKTDYVGTWVSEDDRVHMTITPEGRVEYENNQPQRQSSVSAPIRNFNGDNFEVGFGPFSTEFHVKQAPSMDAQGNWFMVVDKYTLAKVSK